MELVARKEDDFAVFVDHHNTLVLSFPKEMGRFLAVRSRKPEHSGRRERLHR